MPATDEAGLRVTVSVKLSRYHADLIRDLAKKAGTNASDFLRQMIVPIIDREEAREPVPETDIDVLGAQLEDLRGQLGNMRQESRAWFKTVAATVLTGAGHGEEEARQSIEEVGAQILNSLPPR